MIETNRGELILKGSIPTLLSDLTVICSEIKKTIMEDGKSEDEAKQHLQRSLDMAFMSKDELNEEVKKSLMNILLKGLV